MLGQKKIIFLLLCCIETSQDYSQRRKSIYYGGFFNQMSQKHTKKVNTIISFADKEPVSVVIASEEAVWPYRRCLEPAL